MEHVWFYLWIFLCAALGTVVGQKTLDFLYPNQKLKSLSDKYDKLLNLYTKIDDPMKVNVGEINCKSCTNPMKGSASQRTVAYCGRCRELKYNSWERSDMPHRHIGD